MNEVGEKYLPIGSVVLLEGATKKVMITGFASMSPDTGEKLFDYSGCIFPEGFFNYNEVCVFDHSQIAEVFFRGFENDEAKEYISNLDEKIKEALAELKNSEN